MRSRISLRRVARRSIGLLFAMVLVTTPAVVLASHQFPDVPTGHTFHSEISATAEAGITAGFGDGGYHPSDPVTRQAMAAFMHRGFGRAALAIGAPPMTSSAIVAAGQTFGSFVSVRQLTITVPGASSAFSPTQLVHLQGRVHFYAAITAAKGCPCQFSALIRDMATNTLSVEQIQTFEPSSSSAAFYRHFDVEALFAATPGPRTYQLEVRLSDRSGSTDAATFALSTRSSLSAMTFPFGPSGTSDVSTASASNVAPADNQLPERRRDE